MKRDGAPAKALLAQLTEAGVTVGGRTPTGGMVERLSQAKMLRPGEPPERTLERFRQLDMLGYGPGKSPDTIALVLLPRLLPCEAVRGAILAAVGSQLPDQPPDGATVAKAARVAGLITEQASELVADSWQQSTVPLLGAIIDKMANATKMGGRLDYAGAPVGPLEETPEQRKAVMGETFAAPWLDDDFDDPSPVLELRALVNGQPTRAQMTVTEDDWSHTFLDALMHLAPTWHEIVRTEPLDSLAEAAHRARPLVQVLGALVGQSFDASDAKQALTIDRTAAIFAPALLMFERNAS